MLKSKPLIPGIILAAVVLLFCACDNFNISMADHIEEATSNARVLDYEINTPHHENIGFTALPADTQTQTQTTITVSLRNPRGYNLAASLLDSATKEAIPNANVVFSDNISATITFDNLARSTDNYEYKLKIETEDGRPMSEWELPKFQYRYFDDTLETLVVSINGTEQEINFDKNNTEYTVETFGTNNFDLSASVPDDAMSSFTVDGKSDSTRELTDENFTIESPAIRRTVHIEVTADSGQKKTYSITVGGIPQAQIGETEYLLLQDAINAATDNPTEITILRSFTTLGNIDISGKHIRLLTESGSGDIIITSPAGGHALFTVPTGSSLELRPVAGRNLVLNGDSTLTGISRRGVNVSGGTFTMNDGSEITGFDNSSNTGTPGALLGGGAVLVQNNGTFTMNGGVIQGNTVAESGGAVLVGSGGTFTMSSGIIQNNTARNGGGVYIQAGTFNMSGGRIYGSDATTYNPPGTANNVTSGTGQAIFVASGASASYSGTMAGTITTYNETMPPLPQARIGTTVYVTLEDAINAATGNPAVITVLRNITAPESGYTLTNNKNIRLVTETGSGSITITMPNANNALFTVSAGSSLELSPVAGRNLVLVGGGAGFVGINRRAVNMTGGTFTMNAGSEITGFRNTGSDGTGGAAVWVAGTFIMNGGTIHGNHANNSGGAIRIANATFTMNGGTIENNTSNGPGGGVYVGGNGIFNMSNGTIQENTAGTTSDGGGVYLLADSNGGAIFTMSNGIIQGNTAARGSGVFASTDGSRYATFNISGGARVTNNDVYLATGCVINIGSAGLALIPLGSVATITPQAYTANTPVLTATAPATVANNLSRFELTLHPEGQNWQINNAGNLERILTTINSVIIDDLTAPATGGTSATTITTPTTGATVSSVSWSPAPTGNQFQGGVAYTATITLTASTGYTFTGLAEGNITIAGATSKNITVNSGSSVTITATFPETELPVITISPQSFAPTNVTAGSITGSLSVSASVTQGATITGFQWYKSDSATNFALTNQVGTGTSFSIPANLTAGPHYYFCRVSANFGATSVNSAMATVNVASVISITSQPAPAINLNAGYPTGVTLTVGATVTQGATLSYQWHYNTSASNSGGTVITGATGSNYTIPTGLAAGDHYYYCIVSANYGATPVTSALATVTVTRVAGANVNGVPTASTTIVPTINSFDINAVTAVPGTGQIVEYARSTSNNVTDFSSLTWQESTTFTGTTPGITYYVYARSKENTTHNAGTPSTASAAIIVRTVTFNANGGTVGGSASTIVYVFSGRTVNALTTTRTASGANTTHFRGWFTQANFDADNLATANRFIFTTAINANITLVADWGYRIGDTGPGGGIIFYRDDAGFTVQGPLGAVPSVMTSWTEYTAYYLEAAPANLTGNPHWGFIDDLIPNLSQNSDDTTDRAIGRGRRNTQIIINAGLNYPIEYTTPAARDCAAFSNNGLTDWFLPSISELIALYNGRNDVNTAGGNLGTASIFSSSQINNELVRAWIFQNPAQGGGSNELPKDWPNVNTRPVRAF